MNARQRPPRRGASIVEPRAVRSVYHHKGQARQDDVFAHESSTQPASFTAATLDSHDPSDQPKRLDASVDDHWIFLRIEQGADLVQKAEDIKHSEDIAKGNARMSGLCANHCRQAHAGRSGHISLREAPGLPGQGEAPAKLKRCLLNDDGVFRLHDPRCTVIGRRKSVNKFQYQYSS